MRNQTRRWWVEDPEVSPVNRRTIVPADRIQRRGTPGRSNAGLFVLALVLATGTVLGPPSSAHAGAHENAMSSVLFKSRARLRVSVEPIDTAFDVHYQGMGDRDEANFTLDRLEGASHRFIRYLEDRGVEARPCRNYTLDLYDLDMRRPGSGEDGFSVAGFISRILH